MIWSINLLNSFIWWWLFCRVNKAHRRMAVLENEEEGHKYAEHGLRKFLRSRPPEIMPTINHFFSHSQQDKWSQSMHTNYSVDDRKWNSSLIYLSSRSVLIWRPLQYFNMFFHLVSFMINKNKSCNFDNMDCGSQS